MRGDGSDAAQGDDSVVSLRHAARVAPTHRNAVALGVVAALAAIATLVWVLAARPRGVPVEAEIRPGVTALASPSAPGISGTSGTAAAPTTAAPSPGGEIVVDVAGRVRRPGLYRFGAGARVDDAVRAAGGALPGVHLESVNLAARISDGQQILLGIDVPAAALPGSAPAAAAASTGPVQLNTAGLDQLEALPGVGPVLAQHILDWRAAHGRFSSVDQLNDVPGIGDTKFAQLRPHVTL